MTEIEAFLREIRDGKHSLPGVLVWIDRLLAGGSMPKTPPKE